MDRNEQDFFAAIADIDLRVQKMERSQPTVAAGSGVVNFRGIYNAGTAYAADDSVSYNGSSYVCILASTGNLPTNTTYWQLLAEKGNTGATGAQGEEGLTWRGAYSGVTAYAVDDAVQYNGSAYVCILASTGHLPTDGTYWQLLASKGEQGEIPTSTIYPASGVSLSAGTLNSGNLAAIQTFNDGNVYNVQEVSPAGFDIRVDFSGVTEFNKLLLNLAYTNTSSHTIHVDLYNNTTAAWDTIGFFQGLAGYTQFDLGVIDSAPYVNAGVVHARIFHVSNGNASHSIQIDFAELQNALQGAKGDKGDKAAQWKGAWSGATFYAIDDMVEDGGSTYICIVGHTNHQPPNATYWELVASKGDTGATGADGADGIGVPVGGTTGQFLAKASNADGDTEWTDSAVDMEAIKAAVIGTIYPVGSTYVAYISDNPATILGIGTWVACGVGRVWVGLDAGQTEFDTVGEQGGAKTHTLSTGEIPSHYHSVDPPNTVTDTQGGSGTITFHGAGSATVLAAVSGIFTAGAARSSYKNASNSSATSYDAFSLNTSHAHNLNIASFNSGTAGTGGAHNNLQPYEVVYKWKRTA